MRAIAALALLMSALPELQAGSLKDVEYAVAAGQSLRMDAHLPASKAPVPAVILVHGGGWIAGHRTWSVAPLFQPLSEAGFAWFSISYRLATDFMSFGQAIDDVRAAVRHVRAHAREYNIDPNRIALVGESAGAHLAAMAALADLKSVAAVAAFYLPSDLEAMALTSPAIPQQIRDVVSGSGVRELLLSHLRSLSPVHQIKPGAPPFLLIHGTADSLVPFEQSQKMNEKLRAAGVGSKLVAIPGGAHGLRLWDRTRAQSLYRDELIGWLRKHLA